MLGVALALVLPALRSAFLVPASMNSRNRWPITLLHSSAVDNRPAKLQTDVRLDEQYTDSVIYEQLCQLLEVFPVNGTFLHTSLNGIRGVHVATPVARGDVLLGIPLSDACIRDDESTISTYNNNWAARLASAFLQKQSSADQVFELFSNLLPEPELLTATLPVYWPSDVLTSAGSTSLEVQVDSAYFARAQAVEDILADVDDSTFTNQQVEYALDIVQTRSCRLKFDGRDVRCLVPIFDLINHHGTPNAEYSLRGNSLVVTALSDLKEGEPILIDYGDAARPAYKCLASYGFVPEFDEDDESATAEVYMNGVRYEVGRSSIPEAMVAALTMDDPQNVVPDDIVLTPELAIRLAGRLADASFQLLLDPLADAQINEQTARNPSLRLAKEMRWHQHRVLSSCSRGLKDWAAVQQQ
jgi:hypothetical protein